MGIRDIAVASLKKAVGYLVIIPFTLYVLERTLLSEGIKVPWMGGFTNLIIGYGIVLTILAGMEASRKFGVWGVLTLKITEVVTTILFWMVASGPIFGRPVGGLGLRIEFENYVISDLIVGGNILGLLAILILLKISSLRPALECIAAPYKSEVITK